MAQARFSGVSARSQLFLDAVNLEFVTGNLLRGQPAAATPQSVDGKNEDSSEKFSPRRSDFLLLNGCGRAPAINIIGSFFPAWMICLTAGVILAFLVRFFLLRYRIETEVGPLALIYPVRRCFLYVSAVADFFR